MERGLESIRATCASQPGGGAGGERKARRRAWGRGEVEEAAAREFGDDGDDDDSAAANAGATLLLRPLLDVRCARGVESCISSPISSAKDWEKGRRAGTKGGRERL